MEEKEAFEILGLTKNASFREIMEAHRDLVEVWEPKRFSNNPRLESKAVQKFKEINQAFDLLRGTRLGDQKPPPLRTESQRRKSRKKTIDETLVGSLQGRNKPSGNGLSPLKSRAKKKSSSASVWLIAAIVIIAIALVVFLSSESADQENDEMNLQSDPTTSISSEQEPSEKEREVPDPGKIQAGEVNPEESKSGEINGSASPAAESEPMKDKDRDNNPGTDPKKPVLKREVIE